MLSKKHQAAYVKELEQQVEKYKEQMMAATGEEGTTVPELDAPAKLLLEKGIVTEQWQSVGTRIEYYRSRLERGGWYSPGPLNLDEEEDDNFDQDDLNANNEDKNASQGNDSVRYKRYFYQMDFEVEFMLPTLS